MKYIISILKKIPIKDAVYILLIVVLFTMYILRGKESSDEIQDAVKLERLENEIRIKNDSISYYTNVERNLQDSLQILKNQRIINGTKIKEVYKEIPIKYAVVDALDVQHLEQFFAEWDYENDTE